MNRLLNSFLLVIIVFSIFGCCAASKSEKQENIINSKLKYSIILASGGGFTGIYEGYFIDSLSAVYKWKGKTFNFSEKEPIGKISEEQAQSLMQYISDNNILNTSFKEHGNMTSYISLKGDVLEHSVSWNGIAPDKNVPENIRGFHSMILQIINSLQTKH